MGARTGQSDTAHPTRRARPGRAYSLVELMIALGVLGGGLAVIGTIFPAAMIENKESVTDTMATIIAENGVVICRANLRHSVMEPVWKNMFDLPAGGRQNNLQDVSFLISLEDRAYPVPVGLAADPGGYTLQLDSLWYRPEEWFLSPVDSKYYPASRYGWLVLARPAVVRPSTWVATDPIPNDWQLVIVPYRKFKASDRPGPGNEVTFAAYPGSGMGVGTLVIDDASGQFGYVTSGGTVFPAIPAGTSKVVTSATPGLTDSPAIGCYVIRTGLSP